MGRERRMRCDGRSVRITLRLDPGPDEIRRPRLCEDYPRIRTVLLDVLPRAVECTTGALSRISSPCEGKENKVTMDGGGVGVIFF